MSEHQLPSGTAWSTIAARGRNTKVPPPYRRADHLHQKDLFSTKVLFEEPSVTEYRKSQHIASIVHTALTPGSVVFSLPMSNFDRYTEAYRLVVQQIGPVYNNGFNPLSLRGARSKNQFIFSTKFLDPEDTHKALNTGITVADIQYKAVPYKDKILSNDYLRVNMTLTSYDSDTDSLVEDLQSSMDYYGKVVQIKQRLHEGFFEGEISVLLDRSTNEGQTYEELQRMLYLEKWDGFFHISYKGAQPVCYYCRKSGHIIKSCPSLAKIRCTRCHETGHTQRFCTQTEAELLEKYDNVSKEVKDTTEEMTDHYEKKTGFFFV